VNHAVKASNFLADAVCRLDRVLGLKRWCIEDYSSSCGGGRGGYGRHRGGMKMLPAGIGWPPLCLYLIIVQEGYHRILYRQKKEKYKSRKGGESLLVLGSGRCSVLHGIPQKLSATGVWIHSQ